MSHNHRELNPKILQEAAILLQKHFSTELTITAVLVLSEPESRNLVLRLQTESTTSSIPKSFILKQSLPEVAAVDDKDAYSRFASDWAGLEFINNLSQQGHTVPRFYGGSVSHRFILIEDLGTEHISLVDSLTLANRDKAILALTRFMKALGCFHAVGFGYTDKYKAIVQRINPGDKRLQTDLNFYLDDSLLKLQVVHEKLALSLTADCIQEVSALIEAVFKPGLFTVLVHGDICPDNVFDHEENRDLQLIDFEYARVGSALLDGTYLRMSMPTCWCAKAIPMDVIESMELVYREALKQSIPQASDDLAYGMAYTEACGFWLLQQTLPFIKSTLDKDRVGPSGPVSEQSLWQAEENWVRPRVLSRLQAFIEVASKHESLPHLRAMAENVQSILKKRWPETEPLAFYPAFGAG